MVISEERQQGLPSSLWVVPIRPVSIHEFDGLSQDVLTLRVTIKVVHKAGHGVVKVIGLDPVFIVYYELHELQTLALVHTQHYIVVEELSWKEMGVRIQI